MDRGTVPAGWLPDPDGLPTLRWWDGSQWSDQLAPMPTTSTPSRTPHSTPNIDEPERVLVVARKHWISDEIVLAFLLLLIAVGALASGSEARFGIALICAFLAIGLVLLALFRLADKLEVTTKRVRGVTGVVSKVQFDTINDKVEGMVTTADIFGRIIGYKTIVVRGTGGSKIGIKSVRNADELADAFRENTDR